MTTRPPAPEVRRLERAGLPAAVATLVRAFDDDPVSQFMFRSPGRSRRGLRSFFTREVGLQYLPHGHVYTAGDGGGVAVWGPPFRPRRPVLELLQLLPTSVHLLGPHAPAAIGFLLAIDAHHPKEPHWYLANLGVEPDRQGKGIGSSLLADGVARVDAEGLPAYLESSKERNVPLYARFGFEVVEELRPAGGGPTLWCMWRPAR